MIKKFASVALRWFLQESIWMPTVLFVFYLGSALIYTPGILITDSYNSWWQSEHLFLTDWLSYVYPALVIALRTLVDHVIIISIFHAFLLSLCLSLCLQLLDRSRLKFLLVFMLVFLFAFDANIHVQIMFFSRDITFGLMVNAVMLAICYALKKGRPPAFMKSPTILFVVIFGLCLVCRMRPEGFFLLLGVMMIFSWWTRLDKKVLVGVCFSVILCWWSVNEIIPKYVLNVKMQDTKYRMTLVSDLIVYYLKVDSASATYQEDSAFIQKATGASLDQLIETYIPISNAIFWSFINPKSVSVETADEATQRAFKNILRNPRPFIDERIKKFDLTWPYKYANDNTILVPKIDSAGVKETTGISSTFKSPMINEIQNLLREPYESIFSFVYPISNFWRLGFSITFLLIGAGLVFWSPWLSIFAFFSLARFFLVFISAPANHFKYYFSIYLGGILIFVLIVNDLFLKIEKKRQSLESHSP